MPIPRGRVTPIRFALDGGMDTQGDVDDMPPGSCALLYNYECGVESGYRLPEAFERCDGQAHLKSVVPSGITVTVIRAVTGGTYSWAAGQVFTGSVSGATGVAVGAGGGFTASAIINTSVANFIAGETVTPNGGTTIRVEAGLANMTVAGAYRATAAYLGYMREALAYHRSLIAAVPGEGSILGVCVYKGKVFAFRNAVGGATAVMHEATSGGWVARKSGLAPNGRYEFVIHNFSGTGGADKIYGVSGVHKGFEFDPNTNTWTDITTGMAADAPTHVAVHLSRLFFTFAGGSLQWSSVGDPMTWSVITGAGEIALGQEIAAIRALKEDQLVVAGAGVIRALYGTSFDAASFPVILNTVGCFRECLVDVGGYAIAVDGIGAYFIQQGQISADYKPTPFSRKIQREFMASIRANKAGGYTMFAVFVKGRSQLRIFSPAEGIEWRATLVGDKLRGWSKMAANSAGTGSGLYTASGFIACASVGVDANGNEIAYGGTNAGFVVRLDSGPSCDGDTREARMQPNYSHLGAPGNEKTVLALALDIEFEPGADAATGITALGSVMADMGQGETEALPAVPIDNYMVAQRQPVSAASRAALVAYPVSVTGTAISFDFAVFDDLCNPYVLRQATYDVKVVGSAR